MRKSLLLSLLIPAMWASAGTMNLTTDLDPGTKVKILLNSTSATQKVTIDWGTGGGVNYTIDPNMPAYQRWIEGTVAGPNIKITGNITEASLQEIGLTSAVLDGMTQLKELDLSHNAITYFELLGTTPLKTLNLSYNNLVNSTLEMRTLSLEYAGETLTNLNVSHNDGLICLDIRDLEVLEYFTANDCEKMGSVFICMPEDTRPSLVNINLNNCDLAHFYPVSLPSLRVLTLANNSLMTSADTDPFILGDYPSLNTLDVSGNGNIRELDVTACKKLENLNIADNKFEKIDLSQAPLLTSLVASNNAISSFDLGNNPDLRTLYIDGNPVTELDFSKYRSLQSINISNTRISRADLMNCSYLTDFRASNTLLEFIDFNGQQAERVRLIDLRNNPRMTGQTVDYTIHTLPQAKSSSSDNLLLSGSNAETANTAYATSIDMQWKCDVTGDGTATHSDVAVTLKDATDTGENVTGHLDRLYPIFGMGLDYDFDLYETDGGKFLISQWQPRYFQTMKGITDKALTGVPIHIYPYAEEGKRFKSVTVNGEEIKSQWFVVYEPAEIRVNFTDLENAFTFTTVPGNAISMLVNTADNNGTVSVDWGTGVRTEYTGLNKYETGYAELKGVRIDGTAAGDGTVTIYGDVAGVDLSGFGEYGLWLGLWDNMVSSVDLSKAPGLKYLNLYWNPVTELNLEGAEGLEVLNTGYTALENLDLSHTPNIMWLDVHSDGYGDEEGIKQLSSLDVTGLPILQYLDARGNTISDIDLSKNPYLRWVNVTNNGISNLDLSANTILEEVGANYNNLSTIDLSNNPELVSLSLSGNNLTEIDLSKNAKIASLYLDNNKFGALNLKSLTGLRRVHINGNGMTADQLNDTYYNLPFRQHGEDDEDPNNRVNWNLAVIQGTDKVENDGTGADSSIAEDRGWTPSHLGSNAGSDLAYLDVYTSAHGTVTLKGDDDAVYGHGSKVPKYSNVNIVAQPEEGYEMKYFTLNGESQQTTPNFEMPGIYTKLRVEFGKATGVENVAADNGIFVADGGVKVVADHATVDIFAADGKIAVSASTVSGSEYYPLAPGVYMIRKAENGKSNSVKVIIK